MSAEVWEAHDVYVAFLLASFLSFKSSPRASSPEERAQSLWNQMWNMDSARDSPCAPTDYAHNCPWNDWTLPSEARRRTAAAKATNPEPGLARIRVGVCRTPNSQARGEQMVVAFATVAVDADCARALVLHRGCQTLVAMPLGRTNVEHCGSIVRLLLIGSSIAPVFLHLEDVQRRDAFSALVA